MALTFISSEATPSYLALSSDIAGGAIAGAVLVGKLVYMLDNGTWYVIGSDLQLSAYALPATFSGTIALGTVDIDQTTMGTTNGVAMAITAALSDGIGNYGALPQGAGAVGSAPMATVPLMFNGTTWDKVRGSASAGLMVSPPAVSVATAISGQITVATAGTAVQGSNVALNNGVYIKALKGNTGLVYVGNDGAGDISSANGFQLAQGEGVTIQVANLSNLWFDVATNGDKFCWLKA